VPARRVGRLQRSLVALGVHEAVVGEDAVDGLGQVRVRVEARVEEGYGDAAAREPLVGVHPERRREDVAALLEDDGVRFEL
jgi:hypothetical protein